MNKVARFALENVALRVTGNKIPPYWLFNVNKLREVDEEEYNEIKSMSDEELEDTVRTNALGIPMQLPLVYVLKKVVRRSGCCRLSQ